MMDLDKYPLGGSRCSTETEIAMCESLPYAFSREISSSSSDSIRSHACHVSQGPLFDTLRQYVSECDLPIVIVDSAGDDLPWIAASRKMAEISGYCDSELIGQSFRLLDHGGVEDLNSEWQLRGSLIYGVPSTISKTCRKKSGELFRALLSVQTLTLPYTSSLRIATFVDATDIDDAVLAISILKLFSEGVSAAVSYRVADLQNLSRPGDDKPK